MRRLLYGLVAPIGALGLVTGLETAHPSLALNPVIDTPYSEMSPLPEYQSIQDLYQMRDRLRTDLEKNPEILTASTGGSYSVPVAQTQKLQAVEIRIQVEEVAKASWDRAIRSANQAIEMSTLPNSSPDALGDMQSLWKQAVQSLQEVPKQTLLTDAAAKKLKEYQTNLTVVSYKYDTARSGFLKAIVERTGLPPEDVRITVCHIDGECRRWYGNQPPASPASLIKVPIAIALTQKLATENISLDTKILVSQDNYTEDASDIWVGTEYTLRKLLVRMINQSSNIATNQFIDYLGRDYINQVLRDRGYVATQVNTKLVGDNIYPANRGSAPNCISTDELTEMMRQIYLQQHPGDDALIDALASQYDTVLGYDGLRSTNAIWLGEKTGQNSKALGSTLAMMLDGEYYIMSVVLNYSGNERALRQVFNDITKHIEQQGHL